MTLTLSPGHLLFPIFEPMIELRVVDGFGIAVLGRYGTISVDDSLGESHRFTAYELGGQLSWYPLDAFRSLAVGAEDLYVKVETEPNSAATVTGVGDGVAMGPFIGYKLVTRGGFTFLAQGGVQYIAIRAEAEDSSGNTESDEDSRVIPLLNLNIGWSF